MQDIIVFGIGEAYQQRKHLIPTEEYRIVEFWDNSAASGDKTEDGVTVVCPHNGNSDAIIVIFSVHYYDEMRIQLKDELGIPESRIEKYDLFEKLILIDRYKQSDDPYVQEFILNVREYGLEMISYSWARKYSVDDIILEFDDACGLYYTIYEDKRMYLSREYDNEKKAKEYLLSLVIEQDPQSPHYYWKEDDWKNKMIIDLGAAEGNFALHMIDDIREAVIVEADEGWIEALNHTFADYKDKVKIIDKFVLDKNDEEHTTLSGILSEIDDHQSNGIAIKMDIEGAEEVVLDESICVLSGLNDINMLVCTYHHSDAYSYICEILRDNGFQVETAPGYMYISVGTDNHRVQYGNLSNRIDLRRGLVYVKK